MTPRSRLLACVFLLAFVVPITPAFAGDNLLVLHSDPGDWLVQGNTYVFHAGDGTFTSGFEARRGFRITFLGSGHGWDFEGNAGRFRPLTPNVYGPARHSSATGDTIPRFQMSGDSRGCNSGLAWYDVRQIAYDAGGIVRRIHLVFEYHCDEGVPAVTGELRLDADTSVLVQAPLRLRARRGQALTFPISASTISGSPPTIVAANVPAGVVVLDHGDGTAQVSWTPSIDQQGDFPLGFAATDGLGHSETAHTMVRVDGDTLVDAISESGDRQWLGQSCRWRPGDMLVYEENVSGASITCVPRAVGATTRGFVISPTRPGNYSLLRRWSDESYTVGKFVASPAPGSWGELQTDIRIRRYSGTSNTFSWLWAEWEQHADGAAPAFRGELRLNTGSPITVYAPITRRVHFGDTLSFQVQGRDTLGRSLSLSAWPLPAGATLTPTSATTAEFRWITSASDNGAKTIQFAAVNAAGQGDTVGTDIVVTGDFLARLVSQSGDPIGGGAASDYRGAPGAFLVTGYATDLFMGVVDQTKLYDSAGPRWTLQLHGADDFPARAGIYRSVPAGGSSDQVQFTSSATTGTGIHNSMVSDVRVRRVERASSGAPLRYWLEFQSCGDDRMPVLEGEVRQDIRWRVMAHAPLRRAANVNQSVVFEVSGETPDGEIPVVSVLSMPAGGSFSPVAPGRGRFTWTADAINVGAPTTVAFTATRLDGSVDTTWTMLDALPTGSFHMERDGRTLDLDSGRGQFRTRMGTSGGLVTFSTASGDTVWTIDVHRDCCDSLVVGTYGIGTDWWEPGFCVDSVYDRFACSADTGHFTISDMSRLANGTLSRFVANFSKNALGGEFPVPSSGWLFIGVPGGVDAGPPPVAPAVFRMLGVWPNPAAHGARIHLALPHAGDVMITLYDVRGRRVTSQEWRGMAAGTHAFDPPRSGPLQAGLYFIEVQYEDVRAVRRMIVLK